MYNYYKYIYMYMYMYIYMYIYMYMYIYIYMYMYMHVFGLLPWIIYSIIQSLIFGDHKIVYSKILKY